MSDAREIIAKWAWGTEVSARGNATMALRELSDAGFRIIGKDEVDPVTLEKAADAAEERAEWVPLKAGDMRAAIRAIGRKA